MDLYYGTRRGKGVIIKMEKILCFALGYVLASVIAILVIKVKASFGTIKMMKNPQNDPDNPYILRFGADPRKWLEKDYVVLEVNRK